MESMHGAEEQIRLAVLDGDGSMRNLAGSIVDAMDHPCATPLAYHSFEPFYAASTQVRPDVMIVDLETLGQDGHLSRLAAAQPQAFLMAVSTGQSLSRSLAAMEAGAHDVISAGVDPASAAEKIDRFLIQNARPARSDGTRRAGRALSGAVRASDGAPHRFEAFIGGSARMREIYDQIERMAPSGAPVFITGESGSGKQLCASAIHTRSPRRDKPFVALNCAAVAGASLEDELFGHPEDGDETRLGAAEAADGGTLFLDEIGEMDLALQSKLLRFLQTGMVQRPGDTHQRAVNVRIVCATNRDPMTEISEGRFREDLFYRLHVLPVRLPALRDRREDILPLAQAFLARYCVEENRRFSDIAGCAGEKLLTYDWPGNVRQLENAIRQAVVLHDGDALRAEMLPGFLLGEGLSARLEPLRAGYARPQGASTDEIEPLWAQERRIIETALTAFDGNIAKAAAALEISPSTIYRKRQSWNERMGGAAPAFTAFAG